MITLTVKSLKKKASVEEVHTVDSATTRLDYIKRHPLELVLEGASYETSSEKELLADYLVMGKDN